MSGIDSRFLSGEALYGDAFTPREIEEWFEDERDGYARLGDNLNTATDRSTGYKYHALNIRHGFRHLPDTMDNLKVLGMGSAFGDEFLPLVGSIRDLTIIEPSDELRSDFIGTLPPTYVKPTANGVLPFPDATFDLTLCFGTLHHIPNVTSVIQEMARVTRPGGFLLTREPIISMGDWTQNRPGLTKRERGIPLEYLTDTIKQSNFSICSQTLCCFPLIPKLAKRVTDAPYNSSIVTRVDAWASRAFARNYRYHALNRRHKFRPTSVFIVGRKQQ